MERAEHPCPSMFRKDWINLNGKWTCEFDPGHSGIERKRYMAKGFDTGINVPFCPESTLSGIAHTDFIEAMFYHRTFAVPEDWQGRRIILHFGAVYYECELFIDGQSVGKHRGGSVSFEFDITRFVQFGKTQDLVLYVSSNLRSWAQPCGKQSFRAHSFNCFYTRVTGIWQTVWLEAVANAGLKSCSVVPDLENGTFLFRPEFYDSLSGKRFRVSVWDGETCCGIAEKRVFTAVPEFSIALSAPHAWSPADPFLYRVTYELLDESGSEVLDQVESYAGLRSIETRDGKVFLNGEEVFLRLVLDQGYWPAGLWTAPSDDDLKRDIELSKAAGFNGARLHQKVFEERYHYWADKLGYLTWGEFPSWGSYFMHYGPYDDTAAYWKSFSYFLAEWREAVKRDRNHPSIIAWTPGNETTIQFHPERTQILFEELYNVTKELDPTRPLNNCSGFCHMKTDLWTVHLYVPDAEILRNKLFPKNGDAPEWNPEQDVPYAGQPVINDEFGGFKYVLPEHKKDADAWGYCNFDIKTAEEFISRIAEQVEVMAAESSIAGFCYTQLTDVEQEQNGVYNYDRTAKISPEKLRAVFEGIPRDHGRK